MKSKWHSNVGTNNVPVSYLHEYAIALLWDELEKGLLMKSEVRVRTLPQGDFSSNLLEGIARVRIPDSLTPIGGYSPDIALFDEADSPIRVIEVDVTSPPSSSKLESLRKRGVDVIVVKVTSEDDLKDLCWVPVEARFARNLRVDVMRKWSVSAEAIYTSRQRPSNKRIEELCRDLQSCSPETRRQLLNVIRNMDTLESLSPLSPWNPKKEILGRGDRS